MDIGTCSFGLEHHGKHQQLQSPGVNVPPVIPGCTLLRLISDRDKSKLFLARDGAGNFCAIKLHQPRDSAQLAEMVHRNTRLKPLTRQQGLFEIRDHGTTQDGWTWKKLPLADNLLSLPPLTAPGGVDLYTPLNLMAWRSENADGPPPATLVAQWGMRLAEALSVLHRGGLVHRDVKPSNILFLDGEPALGDYGLVGAPGEKFDPRGTKGFQPIEGTSDAGADLYALGKTLYEVWTGGNRLEFPSLPRAVLDSADWHGPGRHLNEVLLRACNNQPHRRFRSAAELSAALADVVSGRRPINRRRWLLATLAFGSAAIGVFFIPKHGKPAVRTVWRRVRNEGFYVPGWRGHAATSDWGRGKMYSFTLNRRGGVFKGIDLARFSVASKLFPIDVTYEVGCILHPQTRELWIIEGGVGPVWALDPDALSLRPFSNDAQEASRLTGHPYWNPLSGRIGTFGGYASPTMRNDRLEFDATKKRWLQIEPDREDSGPWRRMTSMPFLPDETGRRLFLVGGLGSRSGKKGDRMADLGGFNGRFHLLDDIWELDLKTNVWRCLLPAGHFDPARVQCATYFPQLRGLVIFEGAKPDDQEPWLTKTWLIRPGIDAKPLALPTAGHPSELLQVRACTLDPNNGELVVFAEDGIFRVALDRT